MRFKELLTFTESNPSLTEYEEFFRKEKAILAQPLVGDSWGSTVDSWVDSGDAAIATQIAEKLISNKGYAIFYYTAETSTPTPSLLWSAGDEFVRLKNINVLDFFGDMEAAGTPEWLRQLSSVFEQVASPEVGTWRMDFSDYTRTSSSTWFDEDNDWGYQDWSRLFDSWGYQQRNAPPYLPEEPPAYLIKLDDLQFLILNWSKTAVNHIMSYINTKV